MARAFNTWLTGPETEHRSSLLRRCGDREIAQTNPNAAGLRWVADVHLKSHCGKPPDLPIETTK